MRAEEREPWAQWWDGIGRRELQKVLAGCGFDSSYVDPIIAALRSGATVPDIERLLPNLRHEFDDPPDEDADGSCAVAVVLWWDGTRYNRSRFGAA